MPLWLEQHMDWSQYVYLAAAAVLAVVLAFAFARLAPRLSSKEPKISHLETVLLASVIVLGLFTVYGRIYLGDATFAYWDTGSDTIEQYVPFYVNLIDNVREGQAGFWNFEFGLGTSALNYQSWLLDPFNLVLVPLGVVLGDTAIAPLLVFVQSLKVLVSGLLFDRLLTRYCETPLARILGSAIFSFGGYLMLWGQHYWLGSAYVLFVVVILAVERLLDRWGIGRCICLALATAICLIWSVYCGYMVLLASGIYALVRIPVFSRSEGVKGYLRMLGRLVAPVICGCLLAGIALVPYAAFLLGESSRVTGGEQASIVERMLTDTSLVPLSWIPAILSRLLGSGLITSGAAFPEGLVAATERFRYVNCYEFVMLGFSAGAIILLGQFLHWLAREADARARVLCAIAGALVVLYLASFFLPSLFNVFVAPKYRSAFVLSVPLCAACAVGFERRMVLGRPSLPVLAASAVASLLVLGWSLANSVDGRLLCAFSALVVVALALLGLLLRHDRARDAMLAAICLALVSSSVADAFFVTNNRALCSPADFPGASQPSKDADTTAALAWIASQDEGLYRVEKLYSDWTRLSDGLIEHYPGVASYNSTLDSDVEEFYEMLWPGMIGGGSAYQSYVDDPDHPTLLNLLGVRYLLSRDSLDYDWCTLVHQEGEARVYRTFSDDLLTSSARMLSETDAASLPDAASREAALDNALIVPDETARAHEGETFSASVHTKTTKTTPSSLEATVSSDADALVCVPVPNTSGWSVTIDGREIETFRADYGFIGVIVPAGEHRLDASYTPDGLGAGAALTAVGVLGMVICVSTHHWLERRASQA